MDMFMTGSFMLHGTAAQRSLSYSDQRVMIDRPEARLTLDVIEPEIASAVNPGSERLKVMFLFPVSQTLRMLTFLRLFYRKQNRLPVILIPDKKPQDLMQKDG